MTELLGFGFFGLSLAFILLNRINTLDKKLEAIEKNMKKLGVLKERRTGATREIG